MCTECAAAAVPLGIMSTRVYVGNLPLDVQEHEIEKIFNRYGRPDSIDIKGGREGNSRFAFLEFRDTRDANEACEGENGRDFAGARLRVRITLCAGCFHSDTALRSYCKPNMLSPHQLLST